MQLVGDIGKGNVVFRVCEGDRSAGARMSKGAFRGSVIAGFAVKYEAP